MSREIKFRAWDGKKMQTNFSVDAEDGMQRLIGYCIHGAPTDFVPQYRVMQFTGCVDHLGTEVYEGDIVFLDAKMLTGEIVMDCYAWKIKTGDSFEWLCDWFEDVQVIGNIHQHPDLLEHPK